MARGIQVKRNKIMSTNAALERYINACRIKNLTPNTIKNRSATISCDIWKLQLIDVMAKFC